MSSIILIVNLKGQLTGSTKHVDSQLMKVDATPLKSRYPVIIEKNIKHSDRKSSDCVRKMRLSEETVSYFQSGECPHFEKASHWKGMSKKQRLEAHLKRYDEGFGYTYSILE